jgi:hypothetical protein
MSDNENKTPSKQTSSVPLKKETVRVTLKAADAPPAVPSATLPVAPPTPAAPRPPVIQPPSGAPTTPRAPTPAPTIPLRTAGAPTVGAPTIKLATKNAPIGAPTIALKTANAPLLGGASTVALPKATVALSPPTKPLTPTSASATQNPTLSTVEEIEDETGADTFTKILAGVGLAAALIVLGVQLKMANIWIGVEEGGWSLLLE